MKEIFEIYSQYTGTGIMMMLFFVGLFYVAFREKNRSVRTILLYGSIGLVFFICLPPIYQIYTVYVDESTYWRMWWMLPMGIGIAYVGTMLVARKRFAGIALAFAVLLLGGRFIYAESPTVARATNPYQIPQEVIEIVDYLEEYEENTVYAAFPPEMLAFVRQYDVTVRMPYGREMLDENWSGTTGFYQLMASLEIDFAALAEKCEYNYTRYLIIDGNKLYRNLPEEHEFAEIFQTGRYKVYEYQGVDWEQRNEELESL